MKDKAKRRIILLAVAVLYLAGASLIFYPTVSDLLNRDRNLKIISAYEESIEETSEEWIDAMLREAEEYNRNHKRNYVTEVFSEGEGGPVSETYMRLLDPQGNGVMGYLEIPGIKETLAIYHGTSSEVLENGAGHLEGTSLPVGGTGTHSVLAAHRGLPSAKLFTDIDRLEEGDRFFIHVLGQNLAYEVDRILVVEPDDINALRIEEGKDLVTLLTCTPYGVNTKRLLVRGHRVPYEPDRSGPSLITGSKNYLNQLILITSLTVVLLIAAITVMKRKSRRRKNA